MRHFCRRTSVALLVTIVTCLLVPAASAQNIYASLTGSVVDESGGVLPGVSVTTVNAGTGLTRSAVTDARGTYLLSQLPVGTYTVSAELEGFRKEVRANIILQTDQRAREDFRLSVGKVTEVVEVTATAPLVQTEMSSVGHVIDNRKISELPLNGRDFIQLGGLIPGVVPGTITSGSGGTSIAAAGAATNMNNFLLDGVDNNDQAIMGVTVRPSVELVEEFKLVTNSGSAESGRFAGGQINVTTKSGTNMFRGSAFEFLRDARLDAKNFFDSPAAPIPPYRRNQYGGSLGGPIRRNRTFFFGVMEFTRVNQSPTRLAAVPLPAMLTGDFSALLVPGNPWTGTPRQLVDPITRLPFAGNRIPAGRLDAIGRKVAALYPAPNRTDDPIANYISSPPYTDDIKQFSIRVDHTLTAGATLSGRYSQNLERLVDPFEPAAGVKLPGYGRILGPRTQNAMVSLTSILSDHALNELRIGFNRFSQPGQGEAHAQNASTLGLTGLEPRAYTDMAGLPFFSITGFESLGPNALFPQNRWDNTYQITDRFSWHRGRHEWKFGGDASRFDLFQWVNINTRGTFNFSGRYSGFGLADLLLGVPDRTSQLVLTGPDRDYLLHPTLGFFVQDDWKPSEKLTINAGLRYELDIAGRYKNGMQAAFNPNTGVIEMVTQVADFDPRNKTLPVRLPVPLKELDRTSLCDTDTNNFAPRLGVAYRPRNNAGTVIRGAYGVYYNADRLCGSSTMLWKFAQTYNGDLTTPNLTLANPFPAAAASAAFAPNASISDEHITPYLQQWNVVVQHELLPNLAVEAGYVGSRGSHIQRSRNINQAVLGSGSLNSRRPFGALGLLSNVTLSEYAGTSRYDALEVKIDRRFSQGLSFLASYTYSRSLDDAGSFQNAYDVASNRGPSSFNTPQRLAASAAYQLPIGAGRRFGSAWPAVARGALGNWQVATIVTLQAGFPLTPVVSGDRSGTGGNSDRPDMVGDADLPGDQRGPARWFNTGAFALAPTGQFGNAPKGAVRGPGTKNVDLSFIKNVAFGASRSLQVRIETFNLLNNVNFQNPNMTVNSAQFGKIFAANQARQVQLGVRFTF